MDFTNDLNPDRTNSYIFSENLEDACDRHASVKLFLKVLGKYKSVNIHKTEGK